MRQYFYSDGQQQLGPVTKEELQSKGITKETLVWYEGLSEWTKAVDVEDLADLFPNIPTPPPIPEQKTTTPPPISQEINETQAVKEESSQKDDKKPKKKKGKKILLIVSIVLLFLAIVAGCIFKNQLDSEKRCPSCYLDIIHKEVTNITWSNVKLEGVIRNKANFTQYNNISLHVDFWDKDKNLIKSDDYVLSDYYWRGSIKAFEITIDLPSGLKNKLKFDSWEVYITNAIPNNDF